jgi:hypothetical protein
MWIFGDSNEESSVWAPPMVNGCSAVNYTYLESQVEAWTDIQKAYDLAIGKPHDKFARGPTGLQVPFEVRYDPNLQFSNALVVTEEVSEGTRVWIDWHYARFRAKNAKKYYRLLESLPLKLQCLVLSLSHASYDGKYLELTMDEGNYIQDAQYPEQVNLDVNCIATRDIKAGELLYLNFTEFIGFHHDIEWFDDLKYEAFRDVTKLRGGTGTSAAIPLWDKPQNFGSRSKVAQPRNGYPGMLWPTLAVLLAFFAMKVTLSGKSSSHPHEKNKKWS